jgi:hypothetical protein
MHVCVYMSVCVCVCVCVDRVTETERQGQRKREVLTILKILGNTYICLKNKPWPTHRNQEMWLKCKKQRHCLWEFYEWSIPPIPSVLCAVLCTQWIILRDPLKEGKCVLSGKIDFWEPEPWWGGMLGHMRQWKWNYMILTVSCDYYSCSNVSLFNIESFNQKNF